MTNQRIYLSMELSIGGEVWPTYGLRVLVISPAAHLPNLTYQRMLQKCIYIIAWITVKNARITVQKASQIRRRTRRQSAVKSVISIAPDFGAKQGQRMGMKKKTYSKACEKNRIFSLLLFNACGEGNDTAARIDLLYRQPHVIQSVILNRAREKSRRGLRNTKAC